MTAALLSVADHLYDAPIGELLGELPVGDATTGAVLHGTAPVGEALDTARACERDDRVALEQLAPGRSAELITLNQRLESTARGTFESMGAGAVPDHAKPVTPQLT